MEHSVSNNNPGTLNFIGGWNDASTQDTINDGLWHHVAVTHDGLIIKLFIDGDSLVSSPKTLNSVNGQLSIGRQPYSDGISAGGYMYFIGSIDDVRVYYNALAAGEIKALHKENGWIGN